MNPKDSAQVLDAATKEYIPDSTDLLPGIKAKWRQDTRKTIPSRTRYGFAVLLSILLIIVALFINPNIAAAMKQWFGYIPGIGVVSMNSPLRVLEKPVAVTRDNITLTVQVVFLSSNKTVLTFTIEGMPWSAISHDERVSGCANSATLRLPDGKVLEHTHGQSSPIKTGTLTSITFPPIPGDIQEAIFVLPCIQETLPGKAPINWKIPLHFAPAPAQLMVAPVVEWNTPTAVLFHAVQQPTDVNGKPSVQPTDTQRYGIRLLLDKYIPLDDGYYLIGHTEWSDDRIAFASENILTEWSMKAYDAKGREVPIEPANDYHGFNAVGISNPQPNQWIYHIYGKSFTGPITLRATQVLVSFKQPITFEFDARPYILSSSPQYGQTWAISPIQVDVLGNPVKIKQVTYLDANDNSIALEFGMDGDPVLQSLFITYNGGKSGGGSSTRDEASGMLISDVIMDKQDFLSPLNLAFPAGSLAGIWQLTWMPPAEEQAITSTPYPQACLTNNLWKQALANPEPVPQTLHGQVLISPGKPAPASKPTAFFSALDGSGRQEFVTGEGSFSPDGQKFVYSDNNSRIAILDVKSGQTTLITSGPFDEHPVWSPDGNQIAFLRQDKDPGIFILYPDGSNLRSIVTGLSGRFLPQLAGWTGAGKQILFASGGEILMVDIDSGMKTSLLWTNYETPYPALSPDGKWIVYLDKVVGEPVAGIYLAQIDGTERRLLAQLNPISIDANLLWSQDGKWIIFNTDHFIHNKHAYVPALLNIENCQVIPLTKLSGVVQSWGPSR